MSTFPALLPALAALPSLVLAALLHRRTRAMRQREQVLRGREERVRQIADAIPLHVWTSDRSGATTFVNRAVREYLGLDADAPVPAGFVPPLHPDDAAAVRARYEASIASGRRYDAEVRVRGRDGTYRWFVSCAEPIRDEAGRVLEWVGTNVDIDDRRTMEEALRESEESYRALVEALPDGMLVHDGETVAFANGAAARDFGAEGPWALVGMPIRALCAGELREEQALRMSAMGRAPRPLARHELQRLDGSRFPAEVTSVATTFGDRHAIVTLVRDTTERDRVARELDEQQRALRTLVQAAPYGIVSVDMQWRITQMNPAAERIFGWRAEEVLGGPVPWVAPEMMPEYLEHRGRRSHDPGCPAALVRQRRDGSLIDVELVELELRGEDGTLTGGVGFFTDVTERRRAEEGLREFVQQASEGVWCFEFAGGVPLDLDEDGQLARVYEVGTLVRCNDAMARMYGHEQAADLVGTRLAHMLPATDPHHVEVLRGMIRSGYRVEGQESWEPDRDGVLHCYSNNVVGIVQHGVLLRVWGTQRDITAMKRVQVELEEALVSAEEERLLARTAQREAEEANRAKSDFLAVMSHELRTPLNSVIGFASVLLRTARPALRPNELGYLERIRSNGRHLLTLINDILDLSKIEAGRMELRPTRLSPAALVGEVLGELGGVAVTRGIALRADLPDEPLELVVDGGRLRQVLINLVGNALKFTHEGSVTVRVRAGAGERVVLEVIDTGIGIAPAHHERIFSAFQQAESGTTRMYGGTGLGLAISRKLCELMAGTLEVESAPGAGSTFRVSLPAEAAVAVTSAPAA